nr:Topless-related protein [Ipomoea batatas]
MLPLAPSNIFLRVMRHLSIQYALTIKKISSSSSLLLLMGRLKHGYMIIWVQELIMMPLGILAQQWPIVLMAQGSFHVVLVKMVSHTLWSGMKVKGP